MKGNILLEMWLKKVGFENLFNKMGADRWILIPLICHFFTAKEPRGYKIQVPTSLSQIKNYILIYLSILEMPKYMCVVELKWDLLLRNCNSLKLKLNMKIKNIFNNFTFQILKIKSV